MAFSKQKGFPSRVRRYRTWDTFLDAVREGRVPERGLFSPGYIASHFHVHRQSVHDAIWAGRLDTWYIEGGYILISYASAEKLWAERRDSGKLTA